MPMLVTQPSQNPELPRSPLPRRLAAIIYDLLLLLAVLFFASAALLPFTGGEAIDAHPGYSIYFFMIAFLFYGWFWTHGGQTLGMRAWRLRVQTYDAHAISWWQSALRYLAAIASWGVVGVGFLWCLVDRDRLTWHDRFSMSELVVLPKKGKK